MAIMHTSTAWPRRRTARCTSATIDSVHKIDAKGQVTAIVRDVSRARLHAHSPGVESKVGPYLRGLGCRTANGTVFVAAAGCGAVLMITPKGVVTHVLRTYATVFADRRGGGHGEVYVLEYLHTDSDDRERVVAMRVAQDHVEWGRWKS
jgi:hypothetical protein